jgi:cobalt/nickel transport system permease protein
MALPGFAVFYLFSGLLQKTSGRKFALLSGLAGALAAFGAGLLVAGSLALSNGGFLLAAKLILLSNLPVMVVEAFVTIAALSFFAKVKPELLAAFQRPVLRATS